MRKELYKKIEIPAEVSAEIEGTRVKIKGPEGENIRKFNIGSLELTKEGNIITLGNKNSTKKEKKLMNTIAAHIRNMIKGVQKKFEYELKAVFSHFPITIEVKGHEVIIKNFLGEKVPRKTSVPKGVDIELDGNVIKIRSTDRELAGQAAANLETVTRIRARDKRVFQDGIYMTKKAGKEI
ncbi:MAG: 50S ribosomal protein L6 [Candidatus Pacearchaeota archaeon]|nr:50S ribosomal protein L6 [Nanoarchaeota archaeon]MDZ4226525.1 50S ribosomal protein L6 [Candidatus Pacearchaeota archaeon]